MVGMQCKDSNLVYKYIYIAYQKNGNYYLFSNKGIIAVSKLVYEIYQLSIHHNSVVSIVDELMKKEIYHPIDQIQLHNKVEQILYALDCLSGNTIKMTGYLEILSSTE